MTDQSAPITDIKGKNEDNGSENKETDPATKHERVVPYLSRFFDLCKDIMVEYQDRVGSTSQYRRVEDDPVYKRYKTFVGYFEIAHQDDELDEFISIIVKSFLPVKLYIEEDREAEGRWLEKHAPDWKLMSLMSSKKKKVQPILMISSIYNKAESTSKKLEEMLKSRFEGMDKDQQKRMLDAIRQEFPSLDYPYKFHLYLLYIYRELHTGKDKEIIETRIKDLELMLGLKKSSESSFNSNGIIKMATGLAKSVGMEIPEDKIPSSDQFDKMINSVMKNKAMTNMFGNMAKKMQNARTVEEAVSSAVSGIATKESISAIKETQKDLMGDEYDPNAPVPGEDQISNLAKSLASVTSTITREVKDNFPEVAGSSSSSN